MRIASIYNVRLIKSLADLKVRDTLTIGRSLNATAKCLQVINLHDIDSAFDASLC